MASAHLHRAALAAASRSGGFGLVELMVSVAIGAVVVLGITDLLISSKTSFDREEQFARIQEAGRYATTTAAAHFRAASTLDCASIALTEQAGRGFGVKACELLATSGGDACDAATRSLTEDHILKSGAALGYDGSAQGADDFLGDLPADARADLPERRLRGDVFVVWGIEGDGVAVTNELSALQPGTIDIAEPTDGLTKGHLALISDCESSDLFEITAPTAGRQRSATPFLEHGRQDDAGHSVNATGALSAAYNSGSADTADARRARVPKYRARVFPFRYSVYYICCVDAETGRIAVGSSRLATCRADPDRYRPALCEWRAGSSDSQALIHDIADMRVTYTGDSDGDALADFFADDVAPIPTAQWVSEQGAWAGVFGANVELLVTSAEDHVRTSTKGHARKSWPPNGADGAGLHEDTLGAGLAADRRLSERFVVSVALRSRSPWVIAP